MLAFFKIAMEEKMSLTFAWPVHFAILIVACAMAIAFKVDGAKAACDTKLEFRDSLPERPLVMAALKESFKWDPEEGKAFFAGLPTYSGEELWLARADLFGAGSADILAVPVGLYSCGSGGCTLYVFRRVGTRYDPVLETFGVSGDKGSLPSDIRVSRPGPGTGADICVFGSVFRWHESVYR